MRLLLAGLLIALTVAVGMAPAHAAGPWEGNWDTTWRDGGARLNLRQNGDQVGGSYEPYNGAIDARVDDGTIRGQWSDSGGRGRFEFTLAPDGATFLGRFDNGEWWTGRRTAQDALATPPVDLSSPRAALRTFVDAGNRHRSGDFPAIDVAVQATDFSAADGVAGEGDRIARTIDLFRVINRMTFHIWRTPAANAGPELVVPLRQAGTDVAIALVMRRDDVGAWRLVPPSRELLQETLDRLLAARGQPGVADEDRYETLGSPRATMQAFLVGMHAWGDGGAELALRTLDLSEIPPRIRDLDAPLLADYLRQVLDRIGFVVWQEIPDDPGAGQPYVHFEHPSGSVTITRQPDAGGAAVWRFSAETMAQLRDLYTAVEEVAPIGDSVLDQERPFFFRLRDDIRDEISPHLLERDMILENWQWIGLTLVALFSVLAGWLLQFLSNRLIIFFIPADNLELRRAVTRSLVWPGRLLMTMILVFFGINYLGLAEIVYRPLQIVNFLVMAVAGAWFLFNLVGGTADLLHYRARTTGGSVDEILISLVSGILRAVIVVVGIFLVADVLNVPYQGVLAGLSIGGLALAFAAQSTISNLFGAAILLADRPFRRGDAITAGSITGAVEHVGLRSTRLRTGTDSVTIIPNGVLASATIDNIGQRRQRFAKFMLGVACDTPPDRLDRLVEELRQVIERQPMTVPDKAVVGVDEITASSIDVKVECHFHGCSYADERKARHRLVLDLCRAVETCHVRFAATAPNLIRLAREPRDDSGSRYDAAA